ncbi:MAG: hypothetical protein ACJ8AI_33585 [Rhodopila sp.]
MVLSRRLLLGSLPVVLARASRAEAAPGGVARGSKLMEIDPRPEATWTGVPPRAQRIAAGVEAALAAFMPVDVSAACAA